MNRVFFVFVMVLLLGVHERGLQAQALGNALEASDSGLSREERTLFNAVEQYRARYGLPAIPLSPALMVVARAHVRDLARNHPHNAGCNLHSWSRQGDWSACCYSADHSQAACMWEKPRELTGFPGKGYEIAYWTDRNYSCTEEIVTDALQGWAKSPGHRRVLLNRKEWRELHWKAIGVAVYQGFVVVWFSDVSDPVDSDKAL